MPFSFSEQLAFSKTRLATSPTDAIALMIPGCIKVEMATEVEDRSGIDYWGVLKSGRRIGIDSKTRRAGCSSLWRSSDPELAIERWSVFYRENDHRNVTGWTLDQKKKTDLVLFTFDPTDTPYCYLVGFHHLRKAFIKAGKRWLSEYGPLFFQLQPPSYQYRSASLFVPAKEVLRVISEVSVGSMVESA